MRVFAVFAVLLPLLAACVTDKTYQEPTGPTATLQLHIDPDFRGISAIAQVFMLGTSETWQDHKYISPALTRNEWLQKNHHDATIKIPAGTRVFFHADSSYAAGGTQYSQMTAYCTSNVSFVPEAGQEYSAVHRSPGQGRPCRLDLVQVSTGKAPDSAQFYKLVNGR